MIAALNATQYIRVETRLRCESPKGHASGMPGFSDALPKNHGGVGHNFLIG